MDRAITKGRRSVAQFTQLFASVGGWAGGLAARRKMGKLAHISLMAAAPFEEKKEDYSSSFVTFPGVTMSI